MRKIARYLRCFLVGLMLATAGCLQVETHLHINPDGSGTINERVRFSRRLLDLGGKKGVEDVASLLSKESILKRMQHMGKGIQLVSHKTQPAEGGSREAISVYKIPDVADFQYVSPLVSDGRYPYRTRVKGQVFPVVSDRYTGERAGQMGFTLRAAGNGIKPPPAKKRDPKAPPPPGPTPEELQVLRELRPVFRDMFAGFKVKLSVSTYSGVRTRRGYRGHKQNQRIVDVVDFNADTDMDVWGYLFLENEEIMVDILRFDLVSPNIQHAVKDWINNLTVPVLKTGQGSIWFRPSKHHFDKYMKGKSLRYHRPGKGWQTRPADFAKDGWHPRKARGPSKKKNSGNGKK